MKNLPSLDGKTLKEIQVIAKAAKIPGWHDMRKADLLAALANLSRELPAPPVRKTAPSPVPSPSSAKKSALAKITLQDVASLESIPGSKPAPPEHSTPLFSEDPHVPNRKKVAGITSRKASTTPEEVRSVSPRGKMPEETLAPVAQPVLVAPVLASPTLVPPVNEPTVVPPPMNEAQQKISVLKQKLLQHKTLGTSSLASRREAADQLLLMVRDPFWLHAYWEISAQLVERIRAAMGHLWHTADPVLRLYKFNTDPAGSLRQQYMTDIHIHGGINNWYIDVDDPPSSFKVDIGYLARDGQFFTLLSSNIVETPQRYVHEAFGHPDVSWMGIPSEICSGGIGRDSLLHSLGKTSGSIANEYELDDENEIPAFRPLDQTFTLEVDAELVIKGKTSPGVQLAIKGGNIRLKEDGTFSIRYHLPERRHVFPVVASTRDGLETQTVILAVERNTKVLETVVNDEGEE